MGSVVSNITEHQGKENTKSQPHSQKKKKKSDLWHTCAGHGGEPLAHAPLASTESLPFGEVQVSAPCVHGDRGRRGIIIKKIRKTKGEVETNVAAGNHEKGASNHRKRKANGRPHRRCHSRQVQPGTLPGTPPPRQPLRRPVSTIKARNQGRRGEQTNRHTRPSTQ